MSALQTIGQRQKALLESLLFSQKGMTVDELADVLAISRNGVSQHLSTLEGFDFVQHSAQASTGGRPSKRYKLTSAGKELFPRHYAMFANLLVRLLRDKVGTDRLSEYMTELGHAMALEYRGQIDKAHDFNTRVAALTDIMQGIGYEARMEINEEGKPEIVASNCVFHQLAEECSVVCDLDTAFLKGALDGAVITHKECMVRGAACCRFSIGSNSD